MEDKINDAVIRTLDFIIKEQEKQRRRFLDGYINDLEDWTTFRKEFEKAFNIKKTKGVK